jgi:6-phosphogluconolactonase
MSRQVVVYVGTYTERILFGTGEVYQGKGRGIYRFSLDPDTGRLEPRGLTPEVMNPSFLTLDPQRRFLFAVNELEEFEGQATGTLSAFAVDPADGSLRFLNKQVTRGTDPCHVAVDSRGRFALVSNYMSGSLSVLPIGRGGTLGQAVGFVQHHGEGADRVRQSGPHVHSVTLADGDRYALVADLGLDRLMVYRFDSARGRLKTVDRPWLAIQRGAGPRHLALHPDGRRAYLANELDSTVATLEYDPGGSLKLLDMQPTLPGGFTGQNTAADIHLTADGRFLYASNRGHDSIVAFAVEPGTGKLESLGHEPTQGRTPRNFAIDPSGRLLLAANQDSDTVVSFRIDPQTGRLRPTGQVLEVPTPVCVLPAAL